MIERIGLDCALSACSLMSPPKRVTTNSEADFTETALKSSR
jgi:hypothetical protein